MAYIDEINASTARANRLGLSCPGFKTVEGELLTQKVYQDIPYIVRDALGNAGAEEVAAQCLSYHMRLLPVLSDYFKTELTYTIGYVSMGTKTLFEQSEEQMKALLKTGIENPTTDSCMADATNLRNHGFHSPHDLCRGEQDQGRIWLCLGRTCRPAAEQCSVPSDAPR